MMLRRLVLLLHPPREQEFQLPQVPDLLHKTYVELGSPGVWEG